MKSNLIIICAFVLASLHSVIAKAQQARSLAPDQNPRYMISERKYAASAGSLNSLHGTTIQNTYQAYDWYEARQLRRQQNRARRHEERLNSGYYNYQPSWGIYGSYSYTNYGGNYRYRNGFYGRSHFGVGIGW